jgi:hypothetical protein
MSLKARFFCTFNQACKMKSELECNDCLRYYRVIQRLRPEAIVEQLFVGTIQIGQGHHC